MSLICSIFLSLFSVRQLVRLAFPALLLFSCFATPSILLASGRTAWFSDVPLIDSVIVDAQLSFAFDSPSGRILVLHLQTQAADHELLSAYRDTLAAIGWTKQNEQYVKGDELLKIEKIQFEGKRSWRLTIMPMSAEQLAIR